MKPNTLLEAHGDSPSVSVLVPTRERPDELLRAVRSVLTQDYPGSIECVVIFDQCAPHEVDVDGLLGARRALRRISNDRKPGLAGARNAGVLAATGEILAHCDDDDEWMPAKLTRQFARWRDVPEAPVVATGLTLSGPGGDTDRLAPARVCFEDFLGGRVMEIHSSSLLVRRADMLERIGLVDEELPHSFGEDYEWLLRATRQGPVVAVPEPLIKVGFAGTSFYLSKWHAMIEGLRYILDKVPEFATVPSGLARIQGQVAFAYASCGQRAETLRWAARALRNDPKQPRAWAGLAVAARVVSPRWLVRVAHAKGQGL